MIKVARDRIDESGRPIRPTQTWFDEAERLRAEAERERGAHRVGGHYKHDDVKKALEKLFLHKCAYCETGLGVDGPWDVEHFRPKGQVAGVAGHDGYYWLAYEWSNLYPACQFCNQRRKDAALWDDPDDRPPAGKFDQFPLVDESRRVFRHEDDGRLALEEPLLFDPCHPDDDPESFFSFDLTGKMLSTPQGYRRAEATLWICHLNRRRLCLARERQILKVVDLVNTIRLVSDEDADLRIRLQGLLERFTNAGEVYAATARAVVHDPVAFGIMAA